MPEADPPNPRSALTDASVAGVRLDVALTRLFSGLSRRDAQKLCAEGRVLIRGRRAKKNELPRVGDTVTIEDGPSRIARPVPGPLCVRLVTTHWVVVAKPALQPTAPKNSDETFALANALLAAYPEMAHVGHRLLEPGLLQRLDNGTSGLLVAARTKEAFEQATVALKHSLWRKSYLALIEGANLPERGVIRGELEPWPGHPQKVRVKTELSLLRLSAHDAFPAPIGPMETRFELVATRGLLEQVRVFVGPAFRHQIRAHFAAIGAALVNDEVYGAPREARLAKGRHALHAAKVAWEGAPPLEGFDVTEPLERDLADLFDSEDT